MASPEINTALSWLHIFSAIGWMGTAMFMTMVMGPLMPRLTPSTRMELISKLFPRLTRYVVAFASLTLIFGVWLAFEWAGGNFSALLTSSRSIRISIGAVLSGLAFIVGPLIVFQSSGRMVRLIKEAQENPRQGPSTEIVRLQRRIRIAASTVLVLLTIVLVFMVAAARL